MTKAIVPEPVLEARRLYQATKMQYGICYVLGCAQPAIAEQSRCVRCAQRNRDDMAKRKAREAAR